MTPPAVSSATSSRVEPAGEFALKGRTGTVAAHRVVSLERPATGPTTSFVGRDDELRRVLASYTTATVEREARLVIMVGLARPR